MAEKKQLVVYAAGYETVEAALADMDAIEQLQPVLRPGTILGSFQNGVGNEEAIAAALPEQALLAGSLTVPVSLDEPGTIKLHSRRGGVALAPVSPEVNVAPLVRKLHAAGFKARRTCFVTRSSMAADASPRQSEISSFLRMQS